MALQFPSSPTEGEKYQPSGQPQTYTYGQGKWAVQYDMLNAFSSSYATSASYAETAGNGGGGGGSQDLQSVITAGNKTSASINIQSGNRVNIITGYGALAIGNKSAAIGTGSFSQGRGSTNTNLSLTQYNRAIGDYSHAQGFQTYASGAYSHTEGRQTIAYGDWSHSEGYNSQASGSYSHTEGQSTIAIGPYSHAEGIGSQAGWISSSYIEYFPSSEGYTYVGSAIDDVTLQDAGEDSTAYFIPGRQIYFVNGEMDEVVSSTFDSINTIVTLVGYAAIVSNAVDISNVNYRVDSFEVLGYGAHAEGSGRAYGESSHAEGDSTTSFGRWSHAEGRYNIAIGDWSHAEGNSNQAIGDYSHADGNASIASGNYSHTEGSTTTAIGEASHAEGYLTIASGPFSHTEGYQTTALSYYSHAEGVGTITNGDHQHASGQWNVSSSEQSATIIGKGSDDGNRANILEVLPISNITRISSNLELPEILPYEFNDDSAAAAGGIPVGGIYHKNGALQIRVS